MGDLVAVRASWNGLLVDGCSSNTDVIKVKGATNDTFSFLPSEKSLDTARPHSKALW